MSGEKLTVVVTDSGLGGLSVAADMARRARRTRKHAAIDIVFYNSLFDPRSGYNRLANRDEKVRVFDAAMMDMATRFSPDAIMVACNTLSVLLPFSEVTAGLGVPVLGIVDAGVELLAEQMTLHPTADALIFATQTTVDSNAHREALIARGFAPERIVTQACPSLSSDIERDSESPETARGIAGFMSQAVANRARKNAPAILGFCCTHYGYSQRLFEAALAECGVELAAVADPNARMGDAILGDDGDAESGQCTVSDRVVSMIDIEDDAIASLSRVLRKTSPETADALARWNLVPGMFDWQAALAKRGMGSV